jgi:hypothetical protein
MDCNGDISLFLGFLALTVLLVHAQDPSSFYIYYQYFIYQFKFSKTNDEHDLGHLFVFMFQTSLA